MPFVRLPAALDYRGRALHLGATSTITVPKVRSDEDHVAEAL